MLKPTFHAEKPILTTHPVVGGDALSFPITPSPPLSWWIEMRGHAHQNPILVRPWDERKDSRFVVECPAVDDLDAVIDAIDQAVAQANGDYQHEVEVGDAEAAASAAEASHRDQLRDELRAAIDARYAAQPTALVR